MHYARYNQRLDNDTPFLLPIGEEAYGSLQTFISPTLCMNLTLFCARIEIIELFSFTITFPWVKKLAM
jgi:hypothetical protein